MAETITDLRSTRRTVLLFRGFGPLVVAVVLLVLMLFLAPSVAPEKVVTKPVRTATTINPVDRLTNP